MVRASTGIFNVENVQLMRLFGNYLRQTTGIANNYVITSAMPSFLYLKATTARNVLLPFVDNTVDGMLLFIYNEGTGTITFQTSSGSAFTIAQTSAGVAATGGNPAIFQAIANVTQVTAWRRLSAS